VGAWHVQYASDSSGGSSSGGGGGSSGGCGGGGSSGGCGSSSSSWLRSPQAEPGCICLAHGLMGYACSREGREGVLQALAGLVGLICCLCMFKEAGGSRKCLLDKECSQAPCPAS
jgi:hypothetical protein